jgi:hypothetical protein
MSDVVAVASLVVSATALGVSWPSARRSSRALEITEVEHRLRLADRETRPVLGVEMHPSNRSPGDDGVIETDATTVYVNLAITITNRGTATAGRTHVDVWAPAVIETTTLKWMDPSSAEQDRFGFSTPDPSTRLDTRDGREFDTQRMTRTLESVPLVGETLYLRIACPVPVQGDATIPVRVRVLTDGSAADETYPIRLRHTKPPY